MTTTRQIMKRLLRMRSELDEAITEIDETTKDAKEDHERDELRRRLSALRFYVDASKPKEDL